MFKRLCTCYLVYGLLVLTLSGCSTGKANVVSEQSSVVDEKPKSTETIAKPLNIKCSETIDAQEGDLVKFAKYCKVDEKTDDSITIVPASVKADKVGNKSVNLTITGKNGVIYYETITLKIKAKPTPTPEPTEEPTQEDTSSSQAAQSQNYSKNYSSNKSSTSSGNSQNTYTPPQQAQPSAPAPAPAQPVTPAEPSQDNSADNDVIASKPSTADSGAPAGSTYDNINSCDAAASKTRSHSCTWNGTAWVLTY